MNDALQWRENIEWQNIWWEQADNTKVKRIALLGDSVTRGYRSRLNEIATGRGYVVDICASSSQVTDPLLWREFLFFLDSCEWKYDKIVLQTGGQHGHSRRCCDNREYCRTFTSSYRALIKKILSYCPAILIVSSTPCVETDNLTEWNDDRNEELEKRNEICRQTADEFHLLYIDIWTSLIERKYEYNDYIHMKKDGNEFIAKLLSDYLL